MKVREPVTLQDERDADDLLAREPLRRAMVDHVVEKGPGPQALRLLLCEVLSDRAERAAARRHVYDAKLPISLLGLEVLLRDYFWVRLDDDLADVLHPFRLRLAGRSKESSDTLANGVLLKDFHYRHRDNVGGNRAAGVLLNLGP